MTRRAIGKAPTIITNNPIEFQHPFAMFGATAFVPILFGANPYYCLTVMVLALPFICKGRIPAYLGSLRLYLASVTFLLVAAN